MLGNEFDFKLHERLWYFEDDKDVVYHARLNSDKSSYDVLFKEDGDILYTNYPKEKVEQNIKEGQWIVQ